MQYIIQQHPVIGTTKVPMGKILTIGYYKEDLYAWIIPISNNPDLVQTLKVYHDTDSISAEDLTRSHHVGSAIAENGYVSHVFSDYKYPG